MQVLPPAATPEGSALDKRTQPLGAEERSYAADGSYARPDLGSRPGPGHGK